MNYLLVHKQHYKEGTMSEDVFPRQLTCKEEKVLKRANLTDQQTAAVRQVWQNTKPDKTSIAGYFSWIIGPMLITVLAAILIYPEYAMVGNLIKLFVWTLYPIAIIALGGVSVLLWILDEIVKQKMADNEKIDKYAKERRKNSLSVLSIKLTIKKNIFRRIYAWLITCSFIALLALNGYILTTICVLIFKVTLHYLFLFHKNRALEELEKVNREIIAHDGSGKKIIGEIVQD